MRCRNRKSEKADSESCGTGLYRNSIFYGHYAAGWFSGSSEPAEACASLTSEARAELPYTH